MIQHGPWRSKCIAVLLLLLIIASVRPVSADVIKIEDYWQLLREARNGIDDGESIDALTDQLRAIDAVVTADGNSRSIDTAYIVSQLSDSEIEPEAQLALLDALIASETLPPAAEQPDAADELQTVLARPEFQYEEDDPNWFERQWERFLGWIFDLLGRGDGGLSTIWGYVAAGAAGIIVLLVIGYWLRSLSGQFSAEINLPATSDADYDLSAGDALDRAETLAGGGDYREAVRYLYLSTLLSLDEKGMLRFDRSKTNREYLRQVSGSDFAPTLGSVIDVFDRVWYGFQPIDKDTYATYATQVEELVR